MHIPKRCVVDTNVPKVANLVTQPDAAADDIPIPCLEACVEAILAVKSQRSLVLDDGDLIFNEYRRQLSLKGQPGLGDAFLKWVHDNRWGLPAAQRVSITPIGDTFEEFPESEALRDFDVSDRKFIAVTKAYRGTPEVEVLQATDSKWWGWKEALHEAGVQVMFLCPGYIESKYRIKMET